MVRSAAERHIGKKMRPHWARHAAAVFALQENPACFPLITALLGHKSVRTFRRALNRLFAWGLERNLIEPQPHPDVWAAWDAASFAQQTKRGPRRWNSRRLKRFARYAALKGLRSEDARPEHLRTYQEELKRGRSETQWRHEYRELERVWRCAAEQGALPPIVFPPLPPVRPSRYGIPPHGVVAGASKRIRRPRLLAHSPRDAWAAAKHPFRGPPSQRDSRIRASDRGLLGQHPPHRA
jgi:hypothetical protein